MSRLTTLMVPNSTPTRMKARDSAPASTHKPTHPLSQTCKQRQQLSLRGRNYGERP